MKLSLITIVMIVILMPPSKIKAQSGATYVDISSATVAAYTHTSGPESKALQTLIEEVEKRSRVRWEVVRSVWHGATPLIVVGTKAEIGGNFEIADAASLNVPEGYSVQRLKNTDRAVIAIVGTDARGLLFGIGKFLRTIRMERDRVLAQLDLSYSSSPHHSIRGHQLGYRPKTNSYDGWSAPMWEQYIRDLAIFGANSVELIPPRSDDAADSPLFPEPPMQMMEKMSALLDSYGMNVWVWFPAMDADYTNAETLTKSLHEWSEIFRRLPRIDAIFVPGGDPGHSAPDVLMNMLEKQSVALQKYHPKAKIWVSPQGFTQAWVDHFIEIIHTKKPEWLGGIVHGPQVRTSVAELRKLVPEQYPIRLYPDITHSIQCQFPVENWDIAFALTEGRECINPRPVAQQKIFKAITADSIGSITYSEGCNDDINKVMWSALEWNPNEDISTILTEYSRYFIDCHFDKPFADLILSLETNWIGTPEDNAVIDRTLAAAQAIEKLSTPYNRLNWRYQQVLYRAYYDAYVRARANYERGNEQKAMAILGKAKKLGAGSAMDSAQSTLALTGPPPGSEPVRQRLFVLAEALFQSIRMQLSVPLYSAISVDRGANLDLIDVRINNYAWFSQQFAEIRKLPKAQAQFDRIDALVNWKSPGKNGFYDDGGDPKSRPHLTTPQNFEADPAHVNSARIGFHPEVEAAGRTDWCRYVETLFDTPLTFTYHALKSGSSYTLRVVFGPESANQPIHIRAIIPDPISGSPLTVAIADLKSKPSPSQPLEFSIPQSAISQREGMLSLEIFSDIGRGGNGRGCQVCEMWLTPVQVRKKKK